jgi:hypothetical protein
MRNRICNGAMSISQENGQTGSAASAASTYYPADQWLASWSTTGASIGTINALGSSANGSPNGSNTIYFNVATAGTLPAGGYFLFDQKIEGVRIKDLLWGTASAKRIIVRFWFKAAAAGNYTLAVRNGATSNRTFLASFIVSAANTWQSFVIPISGDTTGTWASDNTAAMEVSIVLGAGSSFVGVAGWQAGSLLTIAGSANAVGTTGLYVLADVGLYLDASGSGLPPAWEMPDEAAELLACQRYWQQSTVLWIGDGTTGNYYGANCTFVLKRVVPTATVASATGVSNGGINARILSGNTTQTSAGIMGTMVATGPSRGFFDWWTFNARM